MKICQWNEIHSLAVKQVGKPAVYVGNGLDYYDSIDDQKIWSFVLEQMKSIYGHNTEEYFDIMSGLSTSSLFFFDTIEEQYRFYRVFEHELTDSSGIYACTYAADGTCETENT